MKKPLAGAAVIIAVMGMSTGAVHAGERTGTGETTPITNYEAKASLCAFSGLQDFDHHGEGPAPVVPGVVQTPRDGEPGEARACSFLNNGKGFYDRS